MEEERIVLSETEIAVFLGRFPSLSRHEVVYAIVCSGPARRDVERALTRLAAMSRSAAD